MIRLTQSLALIFMVAAALPIIAADEQACGPELAPKQIGILLKAHPVTIQTNPEAIGGVGPLLWGCDYQVGRAYITITIATHPSDPMPCKRKVAFG